MESHQGLSEHRFKIPDMSCASCVLTVEKAIKSIPGTQDVNVNFGTRIATFKGEVAIPDVIAVIKQVGYTPVELININDDLQFDVEKNYFYQLLRQSIIAFTAGFLLMLFGYTHPFPPLTQPTGESIGILLGTISLVVLIYTASDIYIAAYRAIQVRIANMDTLIALGTGVAWLFSMLVVLYSESFPDNAQQLYFESALMIIGLIKFGQALEMHARGKTRHAIERLLSLQPKLARIVRRDEEIDVPIENVSCGDIIHVRPGEQVPVDGIVVEGYSNVDESMFTGESMLVDKKEGDAVIGGTINKTGSFRYRATKIGKDMALAKIIEMVSHAQNTKPSIAHFADVIAAYFVPIVMAIAIACALIWYDFGPEPREIYSIVIMATVLLIACPCAIGLATPLAVMVGVGRAAEKGILVRNGQAFQKTSALTTIVFDKTGTITVGKPNVVEVYPMSGWSANQILQYAASLEKNSEHSLAQAAMQAAKKESLPLFSVERFHAIPGYGLSGVINNKVVVLGNAKLIQERNISLNEFQNMENILSQGQTLIYLVVDGAVVGAIAVADTIKSDSKQAIEKLQTMGFKLIMLSGDHEKTAQAIATEVGLQNVIANVLPHEKVHKIAELQAKGDKVAMVGDGINDAPALIEANVGLVMGSGTDIAIECGDIILMRNSLMAVVDAITISRATINNIKENLLGAFIYNVVSIPIAAGILYPIWNVLLNPMIAGVVMALSSITVVLNASRLRFFKTENDSPRTI